jgi:glycosyltransferase involved in cell wall biosynthesis
VPVFNEERYLDACLASIAAQTHGDFEVIVCDNASTDRTREIAADWAERDRRFRVYRSETNRGAAPNFNWCFELSRGEYFKWCAADDLIRPEYLARCVAALDAHRDASLAYSGAYDIDSAGEVIGEIHDNRWPLRFDSDRVEHRLIDLIAANHACISVFGLIRASALRRSSLIGSYAASDHVLLVELALQGRFLRVADDLLLHREHAGRFTRKLKTQQERGGWFDTSSSGPSFPNWRLLREYTRAVLTSPLPRRSKARCFLEILRWQKWGAARLLVTDLAHYARRGFSFGRRTAGVVRREAELLLCCARTAMDGQATERTQSLLQAEIDWRYLVDLGATHRVTPLLYRNLVRIHSSYVPGWVIEELARQYAGIARRNVVLTGQLIRLIGWLQDAGIKVISYKGPAAASLAYGDLCLRHFADLDLLVRPEDYEKTRLLFISRGYRLTADWGWECGLVDEDGLVCIDLHKSIAPEVFPARLCFDRMWDRLKPLPFGGGRIRTLSVEDMLIVLCVQLCKDAWEIHVLRLSKACDIAELLRAHPDIDWHQLDTESARLGCRRIMTVGLAVAHELLGAPLPAPILGRLADPGLEPLIEHIRRRLLDETDRESSRLLTRKQFHFMIRERWRDKLYSWYRGSRLYDIQELFMPTAKDRELIILPARLGALYYFLRPIRLVRDFARMRLKRP